MLTRRIVAVVLLFAMSPLAFSAGGGGSSGGSQAQPTEYKQAMKSLKQKDYAAAIGYLEQVVEKNPKNANAWNYLGYSHRTLQQFDAALAAYQKALELNPKHRGAHEYLGELYLQTDQLDKAKAQLERIDDLCFLSCKEYKKLKKAIKKYEAG